MAGDSGARRVPCQTLLLLFTVALLLYSLQHHQRLPALERSLGKEADWLRMTLNQTGEIHVLKTVMLDAKEKLYAERHRDISPRIRQAERESVEEVMGMTAALRARKFTVPPHIEQLLNATRRGEPALDGMKRVRKVYGACAKWRAEGRRQSSRRQNFREAREVLHNWRKNLVAKHEAESVEHKADRNETIAGLQALLLAPVPATQANGHSGIHPLQGYLA